MTVGCCVSPLNRATAPSPVILLQPRSRWISVLFFFLRHWARRIAPMLLMEFFLKFYETH